MDAPTAAVESSWSQIEPLEEAALVELRSLIDEELLARRTAAADLDALVIKGFDEGFTTAGHAADPFVIAGLVICPGSKMGTSPAKHDCTFVAADDGWVWDSRFALKDVIQYPDGSQHKMQSVTVLAPSEGTELDVVVSRMSLGTHRRREVRTYAFRAGSLERVPTRRSPPSGDR